MSLHLKRIIFSIFSLSIYLTTLFLSAFVAGYTINISKNAIYANSLEFILYFAIGYGFLYLLISFIYSFQFLFKKYIGIKKDKDIDKNFFIITITYDIILVILHVMSFYEYYANFMYKDFIVHKNYGMTLIFLMGLCLPLFYGIYLLIIFKKKCK